jgi:phospholipase/carboxylesterase
MHQKHVLLKGRKLSEAEKVLVMLHGRGANAEDILSLANYLNVAQFTLLAPQATGNTWYPNSFLAPPFTNEPWLSSAISLVDDITNDIVENGVSYDNIFFLGFSQGACLTLEYVTRNAMKYGGVVAFTGGLIGDKIYEQNYTGDFGSTPVFIGTSDPDPHVPVQRVLDSVKILKNMNAQVTDKIYKNMGHTINEDEIETVNNLIFNF